MDLEAEYQSGRVWAFLGRVATNSGASLAAGGTVLAVGVALGAIGLAEVQGSDRTPFSNGWLLAGVVVLGVAVAWCLFTFAIAMRASLKTEQFLTQIGKAIKQGKGMFYGGGDEAGIQPWADRIRALLEAGLGEGEDAAFLVDQKASEASWASVRDGLPRLVSILDRPSLRVRFEFKHRKDWMGG